MQFSSIFGRGRNPRLVPLALGPATPALPISALGSGQPHIIEAPKGTQGDLSALRGTENNFSNFTWFLSTQSAWINDSWHLKIMEKSRQVGATKTDAFDSVMK